MEMASVDDGGVLSYKWYKMIGDTPYPTNDTEVTLTADDIDGVLNITAPATNEAVDKYYAMVTNTNNEATGTKLSLIHI